MIEPKEQKDIEDVMEKELKRKNKEDQKQIEDDL